MDRTIMNAGALNALKRANGPYDVQVRKFVDYLESAGLGLQDGIHSYLSDLKNRKRIDKDGRFVSYSPSWWNQNLNAVKWSIQYLVDHSPDMTISRRWAIEQEMKRLKRREPKMGIAKADRMPTLVELKTLETKAEPRLSLMIRFLEATSCRISEMLNAEIGKARHGVRITYLSIIGKRGRERDLRLPTVLYDEILNAFRGTTFLFEHAGRKYSRVATTIRIRKLAERTIGKAVTAHLIRHHRGTILSERFGISKASTELGHANISVTKAFYDHSRLSDDEYLDSLSPSEPSQR